MEPRKLLTSIGLSVAVAATPLSSALAAGDENSWNSQPGIVIIIIILVWVIGFGAGWIARGWKP